MDEARISHMINQAVESAIKETVIKERENLISVLRTIAQMNKDKQLNEIADELDARLYQEGGPYG